VSEVEETEAEVFKRVTSKMAQTFFEQNSAQLRSEERTSDTEPEDSAMDADNEQDVDEEERKHPAAPTESRPAYRTRYGGADDAELDIAHYEEDGLNVA